MTAGPSGISLILEAIARPSTIGDVQALVERSTRCWLMQEHISVRHTEVLNISIVTPLTALNGNRFPVSSSCENADL